MNVVIVPLILILHLVILSRLTFTAWPEMLSYPYLFEKGFSLYKDFILVYPPLLVITLSMVFKLFGFTPLVLKIFTWCFIIFTDVVLYKIFKNISKSKKTSAIFLLIYIFLQSFLDGNMLWLDYATVLPVLAAFLTIIYWQKLNKMKYLFLIGLLFALAVLIKQVALIYFAAFCLYYLIKRQINIREILLVGLGFALPIIIFICYLFINNSYKEFWVWAIQYPFTEWSRFPGYVNYLFTKRQVAVSLLLAMPLSVCLVLWRKIFTNRLFTLSVLMLASAIVAIYPRFSYFHLQPTIAFAVIVFSLCYENIIQKYQRVYLSLVVVISFCVILVVYNQVVGVNIRFAGDEEKMLKQEILKNTNSEDKVLLLGPFSSLYVFSDRVPPKRWTDNFGWNLEIPGVQEWSLKGMSAETPKIIIYQIPAQGNWFDLGVYQPAKYVQFMKENYNLSKVVDSKFELWTKKD